jgi:hypothetical protein
MLDDAIDYNAFILSKPPQELWRVSVFGKFPFVRLKQIASNPPYLWYFLKRLFYYKHVSERYIPLYTGFRFLTPGETLQKIIRERLSLARFNDGEFGILVGAGIFPPDSDWSQRYSSALLDRMGAVLGSQNNQVLVAVPDPSIFLATKKEARERGVLRSMWTEARMNLHHYLHRSREYGNSNVFIPEHHPDLPWEKLYDFLRTKDVVIVTGGTENLRHVQLGRRTYFVEAGKHNAFERYETIVTDLKTLIEREGLSKESTLIMASLGPTADILALDLTDEGYQVWDTGHFFKYTNKKFLSMRGDAT